MQLNYQSYGEGHPLIILHGLFGSLTNWQTMSRELGQFYQVFAVDQRNHGDSPHSDSFNYQVMADDLKTFMQAHDLSSAYLLGHSMGGKTVMQFAMTYPEKVDKLIVADMAPKEYAPEHDEIFEALHSLDLNMFSSRKEIDAALAQKIGNRVVRQFLLTNVTRDDSGAFKWKMNLDAIYKNYDQVNKRLETNRTFEKPTLFIRGERSDYIQEEDTAIIKQLFPHSKIVTVAGAGHWVHVEAPEEFSRLVIDFLGT
jgi:esterase